MKTALVFVALAVTFLVLDVEALAHLRIATRAGECTGDMLQIANSVSNCNNGALSVADGKDCKWTCQSGFNADPTDGLFTFAKGKVTCNTGKFDRVPSCKESLISNLRGQAKSKMDTLKPIAQDQLASAKASVGNAVDFAQGKLADVADATGDTLSKSKQRLDAGLQDLGERSKVWKGDASDMLTSARSSATSALSSLAVVSLARFDTMSDSVKSAVDDSKKTIATGAAALAKKLLAGAAALSDDTTAYGLSVANANQQLFQTTVTQSIATLQELLGQSGLTSAQANEKLSNIRDMEAITLAQAESNTRAAQKPFLDQLCKKLPDITECQSTDAPPIDGAASGDTAAHLLNVAITQQSQLAS